MSSIRLIYAKDDDLKQGLLISLGFHIFIFLFFTLKMLIFPSEALNYQAAVRVDLVALPDKIDLNQPPPPLEKAAPEKPEAKAPPKPDSTPKAPAKEAPTVADVKKKQQDALNKLKTMDALEKLKQDSPKAAASKKQDGAYRVKGNILSPGTELTGLNKLQHEEYIAILDRHIKENWTVPEWLAKKNYRAQVRVKIDEKGNIISKQLIKSSGNPAYDDIVRVTIDKSAPFPVPPEKFAAIVSVNGILIGFPE